MPVVRPFATRRRHWAANLSGETFLSTGIVRLAPAVFLAMSLSWPACPAHAANFNVGTDAQLRSAISSAGSGDTITFTANITLGSNLPTVTQNVTFNDGGFTLSGVAAAQALGCREILSEDMSHGRRIGDLVIIDPFR